MERLISNRQKGSFVKVEDVIGREHDKNNIIEMIFDPKFDDGKRITVIPIVGFGGLGKTTLAQLIYNDEIVRKHFDLTNWVCVPEVGDPNTVMKRVYQSFTGDKDSDRLLVGQIKSGIQGSINNKKYLLVVDDIWDENRNSWLDLLMLLECGASGSRVIVNISIDGWKAIVSLLAARKIQSFMLSGSNNQCDIKSSSLEVMFLKFQSLRVLDLRNLNISMVPGKLRHLRYLNLAMNFRIRSLPDDLTRLQNLQTLDLGYFSDLIQLPKDFCKLDSLRHLQIVGCNLSDLPSGFGEMTSLKELDLFIVGKNQGIDSFPPFIFMGSLKIKFCKWRSDAVREAERANLKNNQQLKTLKLVFLSIEEAEVTPNIGEMDKMLMCLQLPPNLNLLIINGYIGVEMPHRWLDGVSNLVCIDITNCHNCRVLPHLSRLPHLKELRLKRLDRLEYIEDEEDIWVGGGDGSGKCGFGAHNVYFPSLEFLHLWGLGSLKGWTRPLKDDDGEPRQLSFPRLLKMEVHYCPMLMSMPPSITKAGVIRDQLYQLEGV